MKSKHETTPYSLILRLGRASTYRSLISALDRVRYLAVAAESLLDSSVAALALQRGQLDTTSSALLGRMNEYSPDV